MAKKFAGKANGDSDLLKDKVVTINRVTKVVKGGRNFRFAAVVVVGDHAGHVGVGLGKASEIMEAVRKGREKAKKNLIFVECNSNGSIYHETVGKFCGSSVLMKPAKEGTGIIAGGPVRIVMEMAGVKNVRTKSIGSNNKRNVVDAAIEGLKSIKTPKKVSELRDRSVKEILGGSKIGRRKTEDNFD